MSPTADPRNRAELAGKSLEVIYRSRQVTGLLIVAALLVAFGLARANWHEVFPTGWWHVW